MFPIPKTNFPNIETLANRNIHEAESKCTVYGSVGSVMWSICNLCRSFENVSKIYNNSNVNFEIHKQFHHK